MTDPLMDMMLVIGRKGLAALTGRSSYTTTGWLEGRRMPDAVLPRLHEIHQIYQRHLEALTPGGDA